MKSKVGLALFVGSDTHARHGLANMGNTSVSPNSGTLWGFGAPESRTAGSAAGEHRDRGSTLQQADQFKTHS